MAAKENDFSLLSSVLVPLHREGWRFVAIFAVVALILGHFSRPLGWVGLVLTLWCAYFFRDPPRVTPTRRNLVVSPADGVVQLIQPAVPPPELGMGDKPLTRVSVFMNVFNVHVNRIPIAGTIVKTAYRPGKFKNAALDEACIENERQSIRLRVDDGREVAFVQVAGLVARRILCTVLENQEVATGERFGLIRFGSRVDVFLPEGVAPLVVLGQTMIAAETVLADLDSAETARDGAIR